MTNVADAERLGVCLVGSADLGPAYPRIGECALDVMAFVPSIDAVDVRLLTQYAAALVGASARELGDPVFQAHAIAIARAAPSVAVVGEDADPAIAAQIGFRGFLSRNVSPDALERSVRAVMRGEVSFPRSSLTGFFKLLSILPSSLVGSDSQQPTLTPRQQQVVDLIAQGATDREIATRLRISQSTAHKHVQNALRRSNARTRSQLVAVRRQIA